MIKKFIYAVSSCLGFLIISSIGFSSMASAVTFNEGRIIDDSVFNNVNSMNTSQINTFLNSFPGSCISPNNGFTAPEPAGYSPSAGFTYGASVSAGQVIYDAAQVYSINPQVLLTTLQKEQSLVTGGSGICTTLAYTGATGYGCPDSGTEYSYSGVDLYTINGNETTVVNNTCVNTAQKAGFSQQVIHAAWLLKFGEERSEGNVRWDVQKTNFPASGDTWDNSDDPESCFSGPMLQGTYAICPSGASSYYDGYDTIDGTSVQIQTGATAALYWYTPHFSGNEHFLTIFEQTFNFGSTTTDEAVYSKESAYPSLLPGQTASAFLRYTNNSSVAWYDDTTASAAGVEPVHLATSSPINRSSIFSKTWPSSSRAATTFEAVYEADGATLAPNQHVVQPGEIVEFDFTFTVPANANPGFYQEYFQPILEGSSNWDLGGVAWLGVTVEQPTYSASWAGQSAYPSLLAGQSTTSYFRYQNTGNEPWYDDTTASAAGVGPIHLATGGPVNSSSPFSATWPSSNRSNTTFSAVYDSDGTTLASNQHIVQPGEIAEFDFTLSAPITLQSGYYKVFMAPIREGSSSWDMGATSWLGVSVTGAQYSASWAGQSAYSSTAPGQTAAAFMRYQNTGNEPWYDDTTASAAGVHPVHLATSSPINRSSIFGSSWPSTNRPDVTFSAVYDSDGTTLASNQHIVQPGEIAEFDFTFTVPANYAAGNYTEAFQPILENSSNWNTGGWAWLRLTVT